jgi:proline dehydrogenase
LILYPHKTSKELRASLGLFWVLSRPKLVGAILLLWKLFHYCKIPIKPFIGFSGYYQFCAGEAVSDCFKPSKSLASFGVFTALDYANEYAQIKTDFDHNLQVILKTIDVAKNNKSYPFAVLKPSSLGSFELLEKKSSGITVSLSEEAAWEQLKARFDACAAAAMQAGIILMIDAEESWIQPAVNELILPLVKRYNKTRVVIAITLQLYLKHSIDFYKNLVHDAHANKYLLGVKLVRGAYMEKERNRAHRLNLLSPVCNTKQQTDNQYRKALQLAMYDLNDHVCIIASHNEQDITWVKSYCKANAIALGDKNLWFSQLYGMRDYLSFSLANEGANVVKYMPFGPLQQSIPYLTRRALENSAMKEQTIREREMIRKELKMRNANA